jgi:Protein of unknown function (DUF1257)
LSKYVELRTTLNDEHYLIEALRELDYEPEVCPEGRPLVGYLGDVRVERAQIIIPRRQLDAASNDIGFARDESGVYQAIVSEYDRGIGFDDAWLGRIAQIYKERQTMAVARAKGYVFRGKQVIETVQGKKIQLRFAVR